MKITTLITSILFLCGFAACSEDNKETIYDEGKAQAVLNRIKGTYTGNVIIDNIPRQVSVIISDNFSIKQLPLKPILERIFTDEKMLSDALASSENVDFSAPLENMTIASKEVFLKVEGTDLQVIVLVGGKSYQISAMMESSVYINMSTNALSLNIDITELLCDGHSYNVKTNKINYFIDIANKNVSQ